MAKHGLTLSNLSPILNDRNIRWSLCIGAGTSLPVFPDWFSLIERIIKQHCSVKEQIDINIFHSMGFSADAMMQAILNKLKLSEEEFAMLLSKELFAPIKSELSRIEWEAFKKVHDCIGISGISHKTWNTFNDINDRLMNNTSASILAQSTVKAIQYDKGPDTILSFNAEALFLALLNYYWYRGKNKKNKFDRVMNSLSNRQHDRIPYVHCHGVVPIEGSRLKWGRNGIDKLVFSEESYLNLSNSSFSWQAANFIDCCLHNRVIFVGVSFTDNNLRRWLSLIHKNKIDDLKRNGIMKTDTNEHYWINKKPRSLVEMKWIEDTVSHLGIRLIWIDDWTEIGIVLETLLGIQFLA